MTKISNLNFNQNNSASNSPLSKHLDNVNYLLRFLNPSSRAPGIIGMISWESLALGLKEEKSYLTQALNNTQYTQFERDSIRKALSDIDMALERIS